MKTLWITLLVIVWAGAAMGSVQVPDNSVAHSDTSVYLTTTSGGSKWVSYSTATDAFSPHGASVTDLGASALPFKFLYVRGWAWDAGAGQVAIYDTTDTPSDGEVLTWNTGGSVDWQPGGGSGQFADTATYLTSASGGAKWVSYSSATNAFSPHATSITDLGGAATYFKYLYVRGWAWDAGSQNALYDTTDTPVDGDVLTWNTGGTVDWQPTASPTYSDTATYLTSASGGAKWVSYSSATDAFSPHATSITDLGGAATYFKYLYVRGWAWDAGSQSAIYDTTDTPSDGDVLTWNTGGTVDWQPDATGGAADTSLRLARTTGNDTLVEWSNDTLFIFWGAADDDSIWFTHISNGLLRIGSGQNLVIDYDTAVVGGDRIGEFAGANLTVTSGTLNVDTTGLYVTRSLKADTATYITTVPGGTKWVSYNAGTDQMLPDGTSRVDIGNATTYFRVLYVRDWVWDAGSQTADYDTTDTPADGDVLTWNTGGAVDWQPHPTITFADTATYLTSASGGAKWVSYSSATNAFTPHATSITDLGAAALYFKYLYVRGWAWDAGSQNALYDTTDTPADGDVLTWNTGGTVDWQPGSGSGTFSDTSLVVVSSADQDTAFTIRVDTMIFVWGGTIDDTLFVSHQADGWIRIHSNTQQVILEADTVTLGGDAIGEFAGANLTVTAGALGVDTTNLYVSRALAADSADTAVYLTTVSGGTEWVSYNASGNQFLPHATNTIDIGSATVEFKAGYFTGTVQMAAIATESETNDELQIIPDTLRPDEASVATLGHANFPWRLMYMRGWQWDAGSQLANYDTTDTPSDGEVLTWNTGGTVNWQPDNSGGSTADSALFLTQTSGSNQVVEWEGGDVLIYDTTTGFQNIEVKGDGNDRLILNFDSLYIGGDQIGELAGNNLTVTSGQLNVDTTGLYVTRALKADTATYITTSPGGTKWVSYNAGTDQILADGTSRVDIGNGTTFFRVLYVRDWVWDAGSQTADYDTTDTPADGDVLTWNTGGTVDWQPAGAASGTFADTSLFVVSASDQDTVFTIRVDTMMFVWGGTIDDSLFFSHQADGWIRIHSNTQQIVAEIDTITIGGDEIGELAGANLTVTAGALGVDTTGLVVSRSLFADSAKVVDWPGNVLEVAKSGRPYSVVQTAINAAAKGDLVYVWPGVYAEDVVLSDSVDIHLVGGAEIESITDNGEPNGLRVKITGRGKIREKTSGNGIDLDSSGTVLTVYADSVISTAAGGDGVEMERATLYLYANVYGSSVGIQCGEVSGGTLYFGAPGAYGAGVTANDYGITLSNSSTATLRNAAITSTGNSGVGCYNTSTVYIYNCYVLAETGGQNGTECSGASDVYIYNSVIETKSTSNSDGAISNYGTGSATWASNSRLLAAVGASSIIGGSGTDTVHIYNCTTNRDTVAFAGIDVIQGNLLLDGGEIIGDEVTFGWDSIATEVIWADSAHAVNGQYAERLWLGTSTNDYRFPRTAGGAGQVLKLDVGATPDTLYWADDNSGGTGTFADTSLFVVTASDQDTVFTIRVDTMMFVWGGTIDDSLFFSHQADGWIRIHSNTQQLIVEADTVTLGGDAIGEFAGANLTVTAGALGVDTTGLYVTRSLKADTATYLTTVAGGTKWVSYNAGTDQILPDATSRIDMGSSSLYFRLLYHRGWVWDAGSQLATYDTTDTPADGDVLTWNTGGSVDWQPDASGGAADTSLRLARTTGTDTLVEWQTDTLALIWGATDDDTLWFTHISADLIEMGVGTDDNLVISYDTAAIGGDRIGEFAGSYLSVTGGTLNADPTAADTSLFLLSALAQDTGITIRDDTTFFYYGGTDDDTVFMHHKTDTVEMKRDADVTLGIMADFFGDPSGTGNIQFWTEDSVRFTFTDSSITPGQYAANDSGVQLLGLASAPWKDLYVNQIWMYKDAGTDTWMPFPTSAPSNGEVLMYESTGDSLAWNPVSATSAQIADTALFVVDASAQDTGLTFRDDTLMVYWGGTIDDTLFVSHQADGWIRIHSNTQQVIAEVDTVTLGGDEIGEFAGANLTVTAGALGVDTTGLYVTRALKADTATYLTTLAGGSEWVAYSHTLNAMYPYADGVVDLGSASNNYRITYTRDWQWDAGSLTAAYDTTDTPTDGDVLTWNTGGVVDWQPDAGAGAAEIADTALFLVDASAQDTGLTFRGDTLHIYWGGTIDDTLSIYSGANGNIYLSSVQNFIADIDTLVFDNNGTQRIGSFSNLYFATQTGVLVLAANSITEDRLQETTGSPNDNDVLTANTGGNNFTWEQPSGTGSIARTVDVSFGVILDIDSVKIDTIGDFGLMANGVLATYTETDQPTNGQQLTWNTGNTLTWEDAGGTTPTFADTSLFLVDASAQDTGLTIRNDTLMIYWGGTIDDTLFVSHQADGWIRLHSNTQQIIAEVDTVTIAGDAIGDFTGAELQVNAGALRVATGATDTSTYIAPISGHGSTPWVGFNATSDLVPSGDGAVDLGTGTVRFREIHVDSISPDPAGRLRLPTAASPATGSEADIAWDSGDDELEIHNGTEGLIVAQHVKTAQIWVDDPANLNSDSVMVLYVNADKYPAGITVTGWGFTRHTTTSQSLTLYEATDMNSGYTTIETITGCATEACEDDGVLTDGVIASGNYVVVDMDAMAEIGCAVWITFTIPDN